MLEILVYMLFCVMGSGGVNIINLHKVGVGSIFSILIIQKIYLLFSIFLYFATYVVLKRISFLRLLWAIQFIFSSKGNYNFVCYFAFHLDVCQIIEASSYILVCLYLIVLSQKISRVCSYRFILHLVILYFNTYSLHSKSMQNILWDFRDRYEEQCKNRGMSKVK